MSDFLVSIRRTMAMRTTGMVLLFLLFAAVADLGCGDSKKASGPLDPPVIGASAPEGAVPISGRLTRLESPHRLSGNRYVPDGETLLIESGCTIEFDVSAGLWVLGSLQAVAAPGDTIRFTSDGVWSGIYFDGKAAHGSLVGCSLEGAGEPISVTDGSVLIESCAFNTSSSPFILGRGSADVRVSRCEFRHLTAIDYGGTGNVVLQDNHFDVYRGGRNEIVSSGRVVVDGNRVLGRGTAEAFLRVRAYREAAPDVQIRGNYLQDFSVDFNSIGVLSVYGGGRVGVTDNVFERVRRGVLTAGACSDVVFTGNRVVVGESRSSGTMFLEDCTLSVLRGNTWTYDDEGRGGARNEGSVQIEGGSALVDQCFWRGGYGLKAVGTDLDVRGCLFQGSPVSVDSLATFSNCVFSGTRIAVAAEGGILRNCVFLDNGTDVQVGDDAQTYVVASIHDNGVDQPNFSGRLDHLHLEYCLLDAANDLFSGEGSAHPDSIGILEGDPQFDDSGSEFLFQGSGVRVFLGEDSPARDAGPPVEAYRDLDGTRNDLGVYGGPWDVRGAVTR